MVFGGGCLIRGESLEGRASEQQKKVVCAKVDVFVPHFSLMFWSLVDL